MCKMEVKEGYKQTEIGVIPIEWNTVRLGEIVKLKNGYAFSSNYFSDKGAVVITPGNFNIDGGLYFTNKNTLRYNGGYTSEMSFKTGDLLMVMTDLTPDCNLLGKSGIVTSKEIILHNQRIGKIIPIIKNVDKHFLLYYFNSSIYSRRMKSTATGSTVRHTSVPTINNTILSLPPLPEQQAIAEVLSDTDNLIQSLEKQIAKKRLIKQGVMQELLTPKEGWKKEPIKKLASISTGAKNTQDRIDDGAYPFFVRSQIIEKINTYSYEGEAILIAGDGVGTGKVMHYYIGKFDFHQRVYKLSDFQSIINGLYFFLFFKNNFYNRIMQMTAKSSVDSIRREMISEMIISFPPIEEQTHIANILSDMDTEISALDSKLLKYKSLKQGLMQTLLTGKIRLLNS